MITTTSIEGQRGVRHRWSRSHGLRTGPSRYAARGSACNRLPDYVEVPHERLIWSKPMRISHFVAIAAFSIASVGTALARNRDEPVRMGYVFPDFWADAPAQQMPDSTIRENTAGQSVAAFSTQSVPANRGTYLYPPNPNA